MFQKLNYSHVNYIKLPEEPDQKFHVIIDLERLSLLLNRRVSNGFLRFNGSPRTLDHIRCKKMESDLRENCIINENDLSHFMSFMK